MGEETMGLFEIACNKCKRYVRPNLMEKSNHTGAYCPLCGGWLKWLSKDELNRIIVDKPLAEMERQIRANERKAIADWLCSLDANDFFEEGILSYQGMFEAAAHKIRTGEYRKEGV